MSRSEEWLRKLAPSELYKPSDSHDSSLGWPIRMGLAFAIWFGVGTLFTASLRFGVSTTSWANAAMIMVPQCFTWSLMTPFVFVLDRKLLGNLTPAQRILCHIPLSLIVMPIPMGLAY